MHIPTLFYYFAIPTPFFSFPMFFLLVHALFSLHSLSIIDIIYSISIQSMISSMMHDLIYRPGHLPL